MTPRTAKRSVFSTVFLLLLPPTALLTSVTEPIPNAVSPGGARQFTLVEGSCPTFSWGSVDGASGYEIVVYEVDGGGQLARDRATQDPVLQVRLPGNVTSWTPSLAQRLARGSRFAWLVRALRGGSAGAWSEASLFKVATGPSVSEVRAALEVLSAYLADGDTLPDSAPAEGKSERTATAPAPVTESPQPKQQLTLVPDKTAISGDIADALGITFGAHGISHSTTSGAAGVVGESKATDGATFGVVGQVASSEGTAGAFDNIAGGKILSGLHNGNELFSVSGAGDVTAAGNVTGGIFYGSGAGLTNVDADTVDGQHAAAFMPSGTDSWVNTTGDTMTGKLLLDPTTGFALETGSGDDINLGGNVRKGGSLFIHSDSLSNTALGDSALISNTNGPGNTAIGKDALKYNTGYYDTSGLFWRSKNTAVGYGALFANTTGWNNTAIGVESLGLNIEGYANTEISPY